MEETTWEQRITAITHIITNPTTTPSLYSQLFISTNIPCYLNWDYPPILCNKSQATFPPLLLRWGFSLFLKRVSRLGAPETSWRSKCPYQVPPPLILAKGEEEAKWDEEGKREYVRQRLRRKRLGNNVHPFIPIMVPNLLLFSLLLSLFKSWNAIDKLWQMIIWEADKHLLALCKLSGNIEKVKLGEEMGRTEQMGHTVRLQP
ncbi:hypothetical protein RJ641_018363 [Dillenia turbinata]|uniref:Transmembrane protein n=1 Tax=Dillenia turbinata TaxID=194707 RepID=A0AAN8YYI5_9MAGN